MSHLRRFAWTLILLSFGCVAGPEVQEGERINLLPLLRVARTEDPPARAVDVVWPILRYARRGDESAFRLLPLWQQAARGDRFHEWRLMLALGHGRREADDEGVTSSFELVALDGLAALLRLESHRGVPGAGPLRGNLRVHLLDVLFSALRLFGYERETLGTASGEVRRRWRFGVLDVAGLFHLVEGRRGDTGRGVVRFFALDEIESAALARRRFAAVDDAEAGRASHLFPVYFSWSKGDDEGLWLLPLLGVSRNGSRSSTWILPPIFRREVDPERNLEAFDVVWPLFRYERSGGETPSTHVRLLPLFWFTKSPEASLSVVFPFYFHVHDAHSDYLHVVPFYGRHVLDDGARTRLFLLPPLWIETRERRTPYRRRDVLWPLGRFESFADGYDARFFPLFRVVRRAGRRRTNLLLFFDRRSSEVSESTLLWPFYGRRREEDGSRLLSLLPLLDWRLPFSVATPGREVSFLWPLASFQRRGTRVRRWIFPFYWWIEDGEGNSEHHLWPLFGRSRSGGLETWSTLFPLFFYGADRERGRLRVGFLYPLGLREREEDRRVTRFWPLFSDRIERDGSGERRRSWVLWPLFSRERRGDGSSAWHVLFELARGSDDPAAARSEWRLLGGFYRQSRRGATSERSLAFLFHWRRDEEGALLRLFWLLPIRFGGPSPHDAAPAP